MKIIRKISVYRLSENMVFAHDVLSRTCEVLAGENEAVTKEIKEKLIRNFIEEVYVYLEREDLSTEAYDYINECRVNTRKQ